MYICLRCRFHAKVHEAAMIGGSLSEYMVDMMANRGYPNMYIERQLPVPSPGHTTNGFQNRLRGQPWLRVCDHLTMKLAMST